MFAVRMQFVKVWLRYHQVLQKKKKYFVCVELCQFGSELTE